MRHLPFFPLIVLLIASLFPCVEPVHGEATGYFHAEKQEGRWWLITPDGKRFISKGVCAVVFAPDKIRGTGPSHYGELAQSKYGGIPQWAKAFTTRLLGWNFNTYGAWSQKEFADVSIDGQRLARTPILNLASEYVARSHAGANAWLHGVFPDVFDPQFESTVRKIAQDACAPYANDPMILGWFTDNELRWGPDWRTPDELLVSFLNLPANAPGRQAALALLKQRYASIKDFNTVWKTAFPSFDELATAKEIKNPYPPKTGKQNQSVAATSGDNDKNRVRYKADCDAFLSQVAENYFRITAQAVHAAAPHHMAFGSRFAVIPAQPVIDAAARWSDVVSFNCYESDPRHTVSTYSVFGKPLLIGEFAFRSIDSGLPNTKGAGPMVKTQKERGAAYDNYIRALMENPYVVGYHWFKGVDEPREGRFDGEDSNYGLVTIQDEPYTDFVESVTKANAQAEAWHATAKPLGSTAP